MAKSRPRVAVACQGGGSHTAFSAGALKKLLGADQYDFVAFSGTSGGAIDALLAWSGLLGDDGKTPGERLEAFWTDMAANSLPDYVVNQWGIATYRTLSPVFAPEVSPYLFPTWANDQLRAVVERHVAFHDLPRLAKDFGSSLPMLLVGAVDVKTGRFKVFKNAWETEEGTQKLKPEPTLDVTSDAILASAAIPTLFRAAHVTVKGKDHLYWDGLFSQNPPVRDLPDAQPDQIWVLQINPTERRAEPTEMGDIRDRRNELAGNLSLRQELHFIEKINKIVRGGRKPVGDSDAALQLVEIDSQGREKTRTYKEIAIYRIEMDEKGIGFDLDTESKLNRAPAFIRHLFQSGETQAERFLAALQNGTAGDMYGWTEDDDDDDPQDDDHRASPVKTSAAVKGGSRA